MAVKEADTLYGQLGDDVLDGGAGADDSLYGERQRHLSLWTGRRYRYCIAENDFEDWNNSGNDTLKFKEGITTNDILIKQVGNNLIIGLKEEGKTFDQLSDVITLELWSFNHTGYYEGANSYSRYNAVENFEFADGTKWSKADIVAQIGTDENDVIYGLDGADTLGGGKGNDTLYGRAGDDTYIFNRGDGQDVVFDTYGTYYSNNGGNDTLKLGEGITTSDLIIQKSGNNVIVALKEEGVEFAALKDKVTLQDWYNINNRIEKLVLSDGTEIDTAFLFDPTENDDNLTFGAEDNVIHALGGNDTIVAGAGNDTIYGEAGNDNLQGENGNDTLYGGEGADTLYGQLGDDVLDGGAGNDSLQGRSGNDTYLFGRGDGKDTVRENDFEDWNHSGNDTLRFKEGITDE
jgi:trimeric autotransporter adhesin